MSSPKRRIETDVMKMLMSDYEVTLVNDNMQEFYVRFKGPEESKYSLVAHCQTICKTQANQNPTAPFLGGLWKIHVELPDQYPYKSPSIGFVNRIFHPNIDELSGSVCLDVINQTWSPMFGSCAPFPQGGTSLLTWIFVPDMINIFEVFLPQLLRYPNPNDPLNGEAAALLMRHPKEYEAKVKGASHCVNDCPARFLFSCRVRATVRDKGGCGCCSRRRRRGTGRGDERHRQHKRRRGTDHGRLSFSPLSSLLTFTYHDLQCF